MSSEAVAEIPEGSVEGDVAVAAPAAAEAPAVLQRWDFSFPEGPLGISLGNDRSIGKVFEGSTAGQAGVLAGDVLTHVAGKDVSAIHYAEVLNLIKAAPRPVVLSFLRNGPASPGAHAHAPRASIASAKTAVRKAGSYVKGFLDSSVKIVQAFDKAIDRAIDDSTKQVAHAARATVRDLSQSSKRASMKIDMRLGRTREGSSVTIDAEDQELANVHALRKGQADSLQSIHLNNEAIIKHAEDVDAQFKSARLRMTVHQDGVAILNHVATAHLPVVAAETKSLIANAATLKELMTALEGKLTKLSLAKNERAMEQWKRRQLDGVEEYRGSQAVILRRVEAYASEQAAFIASRATSAPAEPKTGADDNAASKDLSGKDVAVAPSPSLSVQAKVEPLQSPQSAASLLEPVAVTTTPPEHALNESPAPPPASLIGMPGSAGVSDDAATAPVAALPATSRTVATSIGSSTSVKAHVEKFESLAAQPQLISPRMPKAVSDTPPSSESLASNQKAAPAPEAADDEPDSAAVAVASASGAGDDADTKDVEADSTVSSPGATKKGKGKGKGKK